MASEIRICECDHACLPVESCDLCLPQTPADLFRSLVRFVVAENASRRI